MTLGGSVTLGWGLVIQLVAPIIEVSGNRPLFIAQVTPFGIPQMENLRYFPQSSYCVT